MGSAVFDEFQLSETDFSATSFSATSLNSSHNFLSSMDRLSASLSTPLGSRTAMERDFDRKFMAGINLKTRAASSFSSAQPQSTLSTGFSATSSNYSSTTTTHISPASGQSYKTYNSYISR